MMTNEKKKARSTQITEFIEAVERGDMDVIGTYVKNGSDVNLATRGEIFADYLLARNDFLLSDLIPQREGISADIYKTCREKAISYVSEILDKKGPYKKTIIRDVEDMLKAEDLKPTQEDIDALQPVVEKTSLIKERGIEFAKAVMRGDMDIIEKYVKNNEYVNITALDSEISILMFCVRKSNNPEIMQVVRCLVEHGADINYRNKSNDDVLSCAVLSEHPNALEIVKFLMERGAKPDLDTLNNAATSTGPCALKIMKFLMERGVEPKSSTLRWAAGNEGPHALEMVAFLMERGTKPDSSMLCYAVKNPVPCAFDMVKLLIERGLEPDSDTLNWAAKNSGPHALEIVKLLMERGLEPDSQTLNNTAWNVGPCVLEIMKFLMERGVEPDSDTLNWAALNKGPYALKMVKLLMERGVEPNLGTLNRAVGNIGPYALELVKFLMEWGAKPDSNTLHCTAKNTGPCALEIVKLLMERGANPHEKDNFGYTAFTESLHCGNTAITDYLFSRDDFALSDLVPCPELFSTNTYETYREKAILRVSKAIDTKDFPYTRTVAADIKKILKTEDPEPTQGDIKVLQLLVNKIVSRDWVAGAQVKCDDFLGRGMSR